MVRVDEPWRGVHAHRGRREAAHPAARRGRLGLATVAALATTIMLWASSFSAITNGLRAYSPGHLALLRFLVASSVLAAYGTWTRMRLPKASDLRGVLASGLVGIFIYHCAINYGQRVVSAASASFLSNTSPVFTALLAQLVLHERLALRGWAGIGISFLGTTMIALGEGPQPHIAAGAALILAAALSWSLWFVVQKMYLERYTALEFTAYSVWAGTLFLLAFAPGLGDAIGAAPVHCTAAVVYLGVFPSAIGYVTWAYALARIPASRAASFLYLTPPLAALIAWRLLGQTPGAFALAGGFVTVLGVALVNSSRVAEVPRGRVLQSAVGADDEAG